MQSQLSRRSFVHAVGITGLGVAGIATTSSPAVAEEPTWDKEVDVIVIGSGYAGMAAAIAAAQEGAEVLIVEKAPYPGGNSILCGGNAQFGGGTSVQQAAGVEDTVDSFFDEMLAWGSYRSDHTLLRAFAEHSAETVDWLKEIGVVFSNTLITQEMKVERTHMPEPHGEMTGGIALWLYLNDALEATGTSIELSCKATSLVQDEKTGEVIGIEASRNGEDVRYGARRGVIIAAGGWKSNAAMRMMWDPRMDDDLVSSCAPVFDVSGELLSAALDCGAGLRDMSFVGETLESWGIDHMVAWSGDLSEQPDYHTTGIYVSDYTNVIIVNNDGERFVNELLANDLNDPAFRTACLSYPVRPRNIWAIMDSEGIASFGFDPVWFTNPVDEAPRRTKQGMVACADTIEELADTMGINPDALVTTIERYNGFVDAGVDEDFGREVMGPIKTGPFYAMKLVIYAHDQMGGLAVNTSGQVLARASLSDTTACTVDEQDVIGRLYAVGEAVGGYWGEWRGHGKIGAYMYQGRTAALHAAGLEDRA